MSDMKRQQKVVMKENGRVSVMTVNEEPSMVHPEFSAECDINNIMKRYSTTGEFVHVTSKKGMYADFSEITDYQGMLDKVRYAEEAFMTLPADVRLRFKNNPGELLAFVQDSKNMAEAIKLGLVDKKQQEPVKNDDLTTIQQGDVQK